MILVSRPPSNRRSRGNTTIWARSTLPRRSFSSAIGWARRQKLLARRDGASTRGIFVSSGPPLFLARLRLQAAYGAGESALRCADPLSGRSGGRICPARPFARTDIGRCWPGVVIQWEFASAPIQEAGYREAPGAPLQVPKEVGGRGRREGPGYLNRFSASISGVPAEVKLPSGAAAVVGSRLDRVSCRQGSNVVSGSCKSPDNGRAKREPR
jgi:hypothetical protein